MLATVHTGTLLIREVLGETMIICGKVRKEGGEREEREKGCHWMEVRCGAGQDYQLGAEYGGMYGAIIWQNTLLYPATHQILKCGSVGFAFAFKLKKGKEKKKSKPHTNR